MVQNMGNGCPRIITSSRCRSLNTVLRKSFLAKADDSRLSMSSGLDLCKLRCTCNFPVRQLFSAVNSQLTY